MLKELIGYTAALVTTFCSVPQLYKIINCKNSEGVSVLTYIILLSGQILWIGYGFMSDDKVVIFANFVSGFVSLLIIIAFNVYSKKSSIII